MKTFNFQITAHHIGTVEAESEDAAFDLIMKDMHYAIENDTDEVVPVKLEIGAE